MRTTTSGPHGMSGMGCDAAREAMSALLDDEASPCDPGALAEHVADCPPCQDWREAAHLVTRRSRLTLALPVPDGTERILAAVHADRAARPSPRHARTARLARTGLAAAALAHSVIFVPALIGRAGPQVPPNASHELGVFNLALAVGLLAAVIRPAWARAMLPLVGATALFLTVSSLCDAARGETTLQHELPHLITVAAALFLALLARAEDAGRDGPGRRPTDRGDLSRWPWQLRWFPHLLRLTAGFVHSAARTPFATASARARAHADADTAAGGAAPAEDEAEAEDPETPSRFAA
jgi:predicted anti-sigma-YlaC factor YlaD